jgi:hypothetical protein
MTHIQHVTPMEQSAWSMHAAVVPDDQLALNAVHARFTHLCFCDFDIESVQAVLDLMDFHQRKGELEDEGRAEGKVSADCMRAGRNRGALRAYMVHTE